MSRAHRHEVTNLSEALRWALAETRLAYADEREEMTCHLVVQSERGGPRGHCEVVTVHCVGGMDDPDPLLQAARAVAAGVNAIAAIWIIPKLFHPGVSVLLERPGLPERSWDALAPSDGVPDLGDLREVGVGRDPSGGCAYVALPVNVVGYATRYPGGLFPPTCREIERARLALLEFRSFC